MEKTEGVKDIGAWRQDHWVRQILSLIRVRRDCGTDVAEHMVRKMRCAGASICLIYLLYETQTVQRQITRHWQDTHILRSGGSQWMFRIKWMLGFILTGWPLPHLHYHFCAARYLIKQKCDKTWECQAVYILSQGRFSWGNNNSTRGWPLPPLQYNKINQIHTKRAQFPKNVFLLNWSKL